MPSGHKTTDVPSRYQPLYDHLATATTDEVPLTFKEIAALIGATLPVSAVLSSAWWTTNKYPHVVQWRAMGWKAKADRNNLRVRFVRSE